MVEKDTREKSKGRNEQAQAQKISLVSIFYSFLFIIESALKESLRKF